MNKGKADFSDPIRYPVYEFEYDFGLGRLLIVADVASTLMVDWCDSEKHKANLDILKRNLKTETIKGENRIIKQVITRIEEYINGNRKSFDLPLNPLGTTFQKNVWRKLMDVEYGTLVCYSDLAVMIKDKSFTRAVANAVACNPVSLMIPCHRVVRSDGNWGNYAGGREVKRRLIMLESK